METVELIKRSIDELELCFYDEKEDDSFPITEKSTHKQLVDALVIFVDEIKRTIGQDLNDIWKRLGELENRMD